MPAITLSSPLASTCSTIALVGSMVITTSDAAASWRSVSGAIAADLLDEVVRDLAARVVHVHGEAGLHQAGRHRPAHVADADEADAWLVGHQSLPFALSTSLNTSVAMRNASRQAGMPQ